MGRGPALDALESVEEQHRQPSADHVLVVGRARQHEVHRDQIAVDEQVVERDRRVRHRVEQREVVEVGAGDVEVAVGVVEVASGR